MRKVIIEDGSPQAKKFVAYARPLSVATLTPTVPSYLLALLPPDKQLAKNNSISGEIKNKVVFLQLII